MNKNMNKPIGMGLLAFALFIGFCLPAQAWFGFGRDSSEPVWISDPQAAEEQWPRAGYLLGFGVCGGANAKDVMARRQAEDAARADLTAMVEVQIDDVVEDIDTEVVKNGRSLVQNVRLRNTQRRVTGLLSGVEIAEVYFDEDALNWHALAVLDRAQAGRGAVQALTQRLRDGEQTLDEISTSSFADYFKLLAALEPLEEIHRLVMAVRLFAPRQAPVLQERVNTYADALQAELAAMQRQPVMVTVDPPGVEAVVRDWITGALAELGLKASPQERPWRLSVEVTWQELRQVGRVRLYEAEAGLAYRFVQEGAVVLAGHVVPDVSAKVRMGSPEKARQRSLERLVDQGPAWLESKWWVAIQPQNRQTVP